MKFLHKCLLLVAILVLCFIVLQQKKKTINTIETFHTTTVSNKHMTLPTKDKVYISVVAET